MHTASINTIRWIFPTIYVTSWLSSQHRKPGLLQSWADNTCYQTQYLTCSYCLFNLQILYRVRP